MKFILLLFVLVAGRGHPLEAGDPSFPSKNPTDMAELRVDKDCLLKKVVGCTVGPEDKLCYVRLMFANCITLTAASSFCEIGSAGRTQAKCNTSGDLSDRTITGFESFGAFDAESVVTGFVLHMAEGKKKLGNVSLGTRSQGAVKFSPAHERITGIYYDKNGYIDYFKFIIYDNRL